MRSKVTLLSALVFGCFSAIAQTNQYAEFQRSISNAKSNAAYIEAIENAARTPNAKYQPMGVDKNAVNELVETWKKNTNRGVPTIRWTEKELKGIKEEEARQQAAAAYERKRIEGRDAVAMPLYAYFKTTGINGLEASRLTDLSVNKDGSLSKGFLFYNFMPTYARRFNEQLDTASFTSLLTTILQFEILPVTAIESLHKLEKKFPEQQYVIDMTYLKVLPYYYNSLRVDDNFTSAFPSWDNSSTLTEFNNLFFTLAAKYPGAASKFIPLCDDMYNPYAMSIKKLLNEKKSKEAIELMKNYLDIPNENVLAAIVYAQCGWYIESLDLNDIKRLGVLHQINPLYLIIGNKYINSDLRIREKYYFSYKDKWVDILYPKKASQIKQLALEGDAEAMNIHAIRVGLGFEKEKKTEALTWLKKAAELGNEDAKSNLRRVCDWTIKGLEDYCQEQNLRWR